MHLKLSTCSASCSSSPVAWATSRMAARCLAECTASSSPSSDRPGPGYYVSVGLGNYYVSAHNPGSPPWPELGITNDPDHRHQPGGGRATASCRRRVGNANARHSRSADGAQTAFAGLPDAAGLARRLGQEVSPRHSRNSAPSAVKANIHRISRQHARVAERSAASHQLCDCLVALAAQRLEPIPSRTSTEGGRFAETPARLRLAQHVLAVPDHAHRPRGGARACP